MFDLLKHTDHRAFSAINSCHSDTWDGLMIFISDTSWFGLLALILLAGFLKYKSKFWILALAIGAAWGLADASSTRIFKYNFKRLRPCHSELHRDAHVPHPEGCGGQYGFVSSHAANSAAIATVAILLLGHWTSYITILWAVCVSYSRIYLGKHYPADVIVGALLGVLCGLIVYKVLMFTLKKYHISL